MIMERDSIQSIGNLQIGDRFCFQADRKKGIVCEVRQKTDDYVLYVKGDLRGIFQKRNDTKVVFLRTLKLAHDLKSLEY
jgi:hypothetical protein